MSIQALREQRQAKAKEARKLVDDNTGAKWTAECQAAYDALVAEIDRLDAEIARTQRVIDLDAQGRQRVRERAGSEGTSEDEAAARIAQERGVFLAFLRGGIDNLTPEQREFVSQRRAAIRNTLSTTTPGEGGYLVPTEFGDQLIAEMKAYGGLLDAGVTVLNTGNGAAIEWPTVDDTAQEGEIVAENAAVASLDIGFGLKSLGVYKYSSKDVAVPFELLQDSAIDLEAYLRGLLVERIARIVNRHRTTGTGVNQPEGIVTASAAGKVGAAGQVASVTYDDLVDLEHSIDPAYRSSGRCRWMFHDTTLRALKKLKDADGRPLWLPGITAAEPATILNHPYAINQDMPAMAADAKSILFGDFSKYYARNVPSSVMLFRMTDSAFTKKGQVGFLAFSRHGGALIAASASAVKHYRNAAA